MALHHVAGRVPYLGHGEESYSAKVVRNSEDGLEVLHSKVEYLVEYLRYL